MNKKEFAELMLGLWSGHVRSDEKAEVWQWIEEKLQDAKNNGVVLGSKMTFDEQVKEARIDENKKAQKHHDSLKTEEYFSSLYFVNRIAILLRKGAK